MQPMSPSEQKKLSRFLAAERANEDPAAEQALLEVFAALPAAEPRQDFAARVMARLEASPSLAALPLSWQGTLKGDLPRWLRLPTAASLVMAGLATLYLLPAAILLLTRVEPGKVLAGSAGLGVTAFESLAALRWIYGLCEQLISAIYEVFASPPFLLTALATMALATLLSRWLWRLLEPARRPSHATYS